LALALVGGACRDPAELDPEAPAEPASVAPAALAPVVDAALDGLPVPMARDGAFRRGVSLGLFVSTDAAAERRSIYATLLDEIVDVGATDVQIVVRWAQADVGATAIGPKDRLTPADEELTWVVEQAHTRGLRVFLMPIVHLETRGKREWRGTLRPLTPEAWWASYGAFVMHYARLAAASSVDLFAVGSELVSMEIEEARWRALIGQVRQVFKGKLTYSANWDHFEPIGFWDAVDVVGVTAYQELSRRRGPSEKELEQGWGPFVGRLRGWAARQGHRYLLTEVGYPSNPFGAFRPWDYRPRGEPDPALQLRCYRTMMRVWHDDPRLDGLFVWNWFGFGGLEDRDYTPRGKPAARVLQRWFEDSRVSPAATESKAP